MSEIETKLPVEQPRLVVHLGDLYADSCSVCGCHAYYGLASTHGPEGCVEAVKAGRVFCEIHLHNSQDQERQ